MADVYLGEKTMTYYSEHREQVRERQKKYNEEHADEIHARQKEWRIKNKEIIKQKSHDKYLENKDEIRGKANSYAREHREKVNKRVRDRYAKNREEYLRLHPKVVLTEEEKKEKARRVAREWHKNNKEKSNERRKEYNKNHPRWHRKYWLKKQFNITLEEYEKLFNNQDGKCAICGEHQDNVGKTLSVDHDHFTDEIRGLLCYNCNLLLGHAKDNPYILRKALEYLENNFV
jgi:hypothetical protein